MGNSDPMGHFVTSIMEVNQNVGIGITFEGREMANKPNVVLLHMQTLS